MASTYSSNLGIELIGSGEQSGTWGTTTNNNLGTLLEQSICGYGTAAVTTGNTTTITMPNGASGTARNMVISVTGTGGASTFLEVPASKTKLYIIFNGATGAITVKPTGNSGISVPASTKAVLYCDGTNIVDAVNYFSSLTLGAALPVASGGTGLATLTANNVILGNGTSSPTFVAPTTNGNILTANGTTWVSSAPVYQGTVTSVAMSVPTFLSVAGSPITASGTLAVTLSGTALPVANGGTGFTSTTAYAVYTGNSAGTGFAGIANGTTGQVFTATTSGAPSWAAPATNGTVTSVAAITLGTTGTDLSSTVATGTTTPVITLQVPTASAANRGALSAADWTTFNNKLTSGGALGTPSSGTVTNLTGTASININGTVGATTPAAGAFTTLTSTSDATIYGVTVGRGGGGDAANTAIGSNALAANSSGSTNTGVGAGALAANTSGSGNTGVGRSALSLNTINSRNTALGYQALRDFNPGVGSAYNIAIGYQSQNTATGSQNISIGYQNLAATTGNTNLAVGHNSGSGITSGSDNVIIGAYSGAAAPISATGSNYIVLSDGDANVRAYWDGANATFNGALTVSGAITGNLTGTATTATTANAVSAGAVDVAGLATAAKPIGAGQTWQEFTVGTARVYNTNYTNSSGRPIMVNFTAQYGTNQTAELNVDGFPVGYASWASFASGFVGGTISAIVPAGSIYQVTTAGLSGAPRWFELR
jgi:hypothetical protein